LDAENKKEQLSIDEPILIKPPIKEEDNFANEQSNGGMLQNLNKKEFELE